jgi:hypothetical protein
MLLTEANTLAQSGEHERAIVLYARYLEEAPSHAAAWNNYGYVLDDLGKTDEAIFAFKQAIALQPEYAKPLCNIGVIFNRIGQWEEALSYFDQCLALEPDFALAHSNRGNPLRSLHRYDEALDSYCRAAELDPKLASAHFNESTCRLQLGDYALGWQKHEWRWQVLDASRQTQNTPKPTWLGETSVYGKKIVIWPEGGFGDVFQFSRFALTLHDKGAHVILAIPPMLVALYQASALPFEILPMFDGMPMPECDEHTSLLSLPLACHIDALNKVPTPIPYLSASPEDVDMWAKKLSEKSAAKMRIGLSWAGNPSTGSDPWRSLRFEQLTPIVQKCNYLGIQAFSLQKGYAAAQLDRNSVIDLSTDLYDWVDTAAAISNLDLVITTCTAIAHLSGAMGKPTWLILSYNAYWLWLEDRTDSPWYPSVRLFRQPTFGDWATVVQEVAIALAAQSQPHL